MKYVHGEYLITRSDQVVLTHAYGPWNSECVLAFNRDYYQEAHELFGSPYADVVFLEGESLLIPDAERRLRDAICYAQRHGLSHVALVTTFSTVKTSAQMQFERVYTGTGVTFQFFSVYDKALTWLAENGFNTDSVTQEAHFKRVS